MSFDRRLAQCLVEGVPTEVFFGTENESPLERDLRIMYAKSVCERCPVIQPCLEAAIHKDEYGVWGGTTEKERIRSYDMASIQPAPQPEVAWIIVASSWGVDLAKTKAKLNRRWQIRADNSTKSEHSLESEAWIAWNRLIEGRMRAD
jgi:hypothetical protein